MNKFFLALLGLVLAACGGGAAADTAAAPKVVEQYLQARIKADVNQMIALSCSAWEPQTKIEASSFQSLKADIENMQCAVASSANNTAVVACTGKIKTTYNGESKERDLAQQQFKLTQEGGEWRMCGYQ